MSELVRDSGAGAVASATTAESAADGRVRDQDLFIDQCLAKVLGARRENDFRVLLEDAERPVIGRRARCRCLRYPGRKDAWGDNSIL